MIFNSTIWLVFSSGLLSSTLLPGNSEAVFGFYLLDEPDLLVALLIAVTVGNTLGGIISWGMGRVVAVRYPAEGLTKVSQIKALKTIQKWGNPALLLSWIPFVGDPLCIAAGWIKTAPLISFVYIFIGKGIRYIVLAWLIT